MLGQVPRRLPQHELIVALPLVLDLTALLPPLLPIPLFGDPPTGRATPGCYLAGSGDCKGPLIREHFISKCLLKQFDGITVTGATWQDAGASKPIGLANLTASVLCDGHSGRLEPLDALAGEMFSGVRAGSAPRVNGHLFERWCVKAILGAVAGRWHGKRAPAESTPSTATVDWLVGRLWPAEDWAIHVVHLPVGGREGVYPGRPGDVLSLNVCNGADGHEVGAAIWFAGIPFFLPLAGESEWRTFERSPTARRPSTILNARGAVLVTLDWGSFASGGTVHLS